MLVLNYNPAVISFYFTFSKDAIAFGINDLYI